MKDSQNTADKIHNFFEQPNTFAAYAVQVLIFVLIIASVGFFVIEFFYSEIFRANEALFNIGEYIILAIFTIEYVLRLATAPKMGKFALKPLSIVDFFAVFPSYLELILPLFVNTSAIRVLRLVRVLRFARVLRAFRLFKYSNFVRQVFQYQKTILQSITPIIALFVLLKSAVWILEANSLWIQDPSLGELFAIIGFALGIILSQKIGVTYDKFINVEETVVRIYGTLQSLMLILDKKKPGVGTKIAHEWAAVFLKLLEDPKTDNNEINRVNNELYDILSELEDVPAEMAILHGDLIRDAAFCLSKKVRLTPKAYDTLLHQSTILYLGLISVFIPGFTGLISLIVATYILYGMYNLTQDFDSIIGGDFDLINIDFSELKNFVNSR